MLKFECNFLCLFIELFAISTGQLEIVRPGVRSVTVCVRVVHQHHRQHYRSSDSRVRNFERTQSSRFTSHSFLFVNISSAVLINVQLVVHLHNNTYHSWLLAMSTLVFKASLDPLLVYSSPRNGHLSQMLQFSVPMGFWLQRLPNTESSN